MSHTVVVEVGRGGEAFAADWALVRLLTRMNPPVRVERAGRGEALAAHIANVRLFTCEEKEGNVLMSVKRINGISQAVRWPSYL